MYIILSSAVQSININLSLIIILFLILTSHGYFYKMYYQQHDRLLVGPE